MKALPNLKRIGLILLLVAGLAASAWYCYVQLPHDPYRNLKEEGGHALKGEKAARTYHWAGKRPSPRELDAALKELDEELQKNPYNTLALSTKVHLGLDYAPEVTAAECDRVLQQSPKNYFALVHGARAYLEMTNLNRAAYYAAKAVQVQDCPEARDLLGDVLYGQRNTNGALKQYQQALAMKPGDELAQGRLKELKGK